jgi:hypothetical protein
MRTGALSFSLALTLTACGAFGSDGGSSSSGGGGSDAAASSDAAAAGDAAQGGDAGADAATVPRSVKCEGTTCTGQEVCCLDNQTTCSTNCNGIASIVCDDTSDCAASGLVCCVDLVVNSDNSAGIKGATCQSSCQPPDSLRACDPITPTECGPGKGCVPITKLHATVFPSYAIFVCE